MFCRWLFKLNVYKYIYVFGVIKKKSKWFFYVYCKEIFSLMIYVYYNSWFYVDLLFEVNNWYI